MSTAIKERNKELNFLIVDKATKDDNSEVGLQAPALHPQMMRSFNNKVIMTLIKVIAKSISLLTPADLIKLMKFFVLMIQSRYQSYEMCSFAQPFCLCVSKGGLSTAGLTDFELRESSYFVGSNYGLCNSMAQNLDSSKG